MFSLIFFIAFPFLFGRRGKIIRLQKASTAWPTTTGTIYEG
ncbi:MAG: hypothetical protein ACR2MF_05985 [Chthoniobacterales bacterium]